MQFLRTLRLAGRNFLANKKRNLFSVFTVVLGSMSIGAVFTVNENVEAHIEELIARTGGPNLFISLRGQNFDPSDLKELSSMTSVRYLVLDSTSPLNVLWESKSVRMLGIATSALYREARPLKLMQGSFLSEWDHKLSSRNIVVSPQALKELALSEKDSLGKSISMNWKGQTLIGTIIGVASPLFDNNDRGYLWMTEALMQSVSQEINQQSLILGFPSYARLESYESEVLQLLSKKYGESVEIYNPRKNFEMMRNDYQMFIRSGLVVGLLSLLAGSVGVMNAMSAGVQLRIREIGLYRALGFPTRTVLLTFLSEALIILFIGGFAGAVSGSLFGMVISSQVAISNPFFSLSSFAVALASSLLIGFVFAYLPARKAAGLETVEALKG